MQNMVKAIILYMEKKNNYPLCAAIVIILSVLFVYFGHKFCRVENYAQGEKEVYYNATVTQIIDNSDKNNVYNNETGELISRKIHFKAEITSGDSKGAEIEATQLIDYMYAYVLDPVTVGDKIIVTSVYDFSTNDYTWEFGGYNRINSLVALCVLFLALIVLIGRKKGVVTIISLVLTAAGIFLVYVPSVLSGMNVYAMTVIIGVYTTLMSLVLLDGMNKKTLSAVVGNIGGLIVAGLIALIMNAVLDITGLSDEDYVSLMLLDTGVEIDLTAVIWGGMVIGALGAIMDVAMSIASAMQELADNVNECKFSALFKSGMNIGKDAIGTMTNTLILAYIGGSLVTVLLLVAYNKDLRFLFNLEMISIEIVQAISGSIGIICAVPLTAMFSAFIFSKNK